MLSGALLCACGKMPSARNAQDARLGHAAAADVAVDPVPVPARLEAQAAADPLQGCDETLLDETTDRGRILVATCPEGAEAEVRFVQKDGANVHGSAFRMDSASYSAIVDAGAKLWDKKVVSVDLA
ncbi:hypothetical protein PRJ39_22830 [Lysobacter enzymogenes]|uniref:hypothetical protein n=1 Tax=Lysobacter enzymogenes TaxID=69 RepID=UPI0037497815